MTEKGDRTHGMVIDVQERCGLKPQLRSRPVGDALIERASIERQRAFVITRHLVGKDQTLFLCSSAQVFVKAGDVAHIATRLHLSLLHDIFSRAGLCFGVLGITTTLNNKMYTVTKTSARIYRIVMPLEWTLYLLPKCKVRWICSLSMSQGVGLRSVPT